LKNWFELSEPTILSSDYRKKYESLFINK
jgi:hypothetical protein